MIDFTAARSLIKLPPAEFLAKVEKADGFTYRGGLLVRQRLRAVKNDAGLLPETRGLAEKLWRKLCAEQFKKQSEKQSALASEPANETRTPRAVVHNIHNVDEDPEADPLAELLPALLAYDREKAAEQAWREKFGSLDIQGSEGCGWSLGTCDLCGRNDWVAQRLTPTGLHWLDFACNQKVKELWQAPDAEEQFQAALAAEVGSS